MTLSRKKGFGAPRRRPGLRVLSAMFAALLVGAGGIPAVSAATNATSGGSIGDVAYAADCSIAGAPGLVVPIIVGLNVNAAPDAIEATGASFGATGRVDLPVLGSILAGINQAGVAGSSLTISTDLTVGSTDGTATGSYSYSHAFPPIAEGDVGDPGRPITGATWANGSTTLYSPNFDSADNGEFIVGPSDGGITAGAFIVGIDPGVSATINTPTTAAEGAPVVVGVGRTTTLSDATFDTGSAFTTNGNPGGAANIGVTSISDVTATGTAPVVIGGSPGVGPANCVETGWQLSPNPNTSGAPGPAQVGETQPLLCCGGGLMTFNADYLLKASNGAIAQSGTSVMITPPPAAHVTLFSHQPTVTITPSANPGATGPITYGVSVTAPIGTPTGSVTVSDGHGSCTIASLSNGGGSCLIEETSANSPYTVTANYSGDGNYVATSTSISEEIDGAATCPVVPPSGQWIGTYSSVNLIPPIYGSIETDFTQSNGSMSGTILEETGQSSILPGTPFSGTLDCNRTDVTAAGLEAIGTISPDGLRVTGHSYSGGVLIANWVMGLVQTHVATDGTSLTTDTESTGTSASTPLQVSVDSPTNGALGIGVAQSNGAVLDGYNVLGQVVKISAPSATAEAPLTFTFDVDSTLSGGAPASAVSIFRNGVAVADCDGPVGVASPDPCVTSRTDLGGGNTRFTVLSSGASVWAMGTASGISVGSASIAEGTTGKPRTISFPVTISAPPTSDVSVHYSIQGDGSATGATKPGLGVDFKTMSGTVKFKAHTTTLTKYVRTQVYPDAAQEGDETFAVVLSDATGGYGITTATGTGTIIDDDPGTGLRAFVGDESIWEGNSGKNTASVLISLSDPATTKFSLTVAIGGGTAHLGTDYKKAITKTVTFLPRQFQKVVTLPIFPNTTHDGDRTINVVLSNPSPANSVTLTRPMGTITILDDD
jgi:hypothetical protein